MQITFNLPHVFNPNSTPEENAPVLQAILEALIQINVAYLRRAKNHTPLYQSGVIYGRTYWFEPIPALYERRFGDCKSLSAALIAEYRSQGKEAIPVFRWVTKRDGTRDFHILVQSINGFEDPSKRLGMGDNENRRF